MKTLFTFPGQGTQRAGMLHELPDDGKILDEARQILGDDEVNLLDTPEALKHTRAVQLSLLIAGVAWARELELRGVKPDMTAGLSIGAFPAAVVAGALRFDDALRLVALRGDLMEQAYPEGYGLTAIMGLTLDQVTPLLEDGVYIANLNAERQIVIAGENAQMARVGQKAMAKGANKVHQLAVSVPSHCVLLAEPARKLQAAFNRVTLERPRCEYLSGSTARVIWQPERIADDLALNMSRTVRWSESMAAAEERGVGLAVEMPPGGVLTCLTRQAITHEETLSLERSGINVVVHVANKLRQ